LARCCAKRGSAFRPTPKTLEGSQHPDRDAQFRYLAGQVTEHQATDDPVISVDAKKKELVGPFANNGREWRPAGQPERVNVHDFADPALGKAIPYGVYDLQANTGWINVGCDHDTAAFAVESIRRWWNDQGQHTYPAARRLLITADAGGSNGYRTRAWKLQLADLAAQTGLTITVCHLPPGTSKWNKIEHRLFSHITTNWRGRPLTSHEVILASITATTTASGLRVRAQLDTGTYPTGTPISATDLAGIPLTRHAFDGDWNYVLHPGLPAGRLPARPRHRRSLQRHQHQQRRRPVEPGTAGRSRPDRHDQRRTPRSEGRARPPTRRRHPSPRRSTLAPDLHRTGPGHCPAPSHRTTRTTPGHSVRHQPRGNAPRPDQNHPTPPATRHHHPASHSAARSPPRPRRNPIDTAFGAQIGQLIFGSP
jgi:hypothetical protein